MLAIIVSQLDMEVMEGQEELITSIEDQEEEEVLIPSGSLCFQHEVLNYDSLNYFRLVSDHRKEQSVELLLKLLLILKEGLPEMKVDFLYSSVFSPSSQSLLYFQRNELIGGLCFSSQPPLSARIEYLSIQEASRANGKGRLLINTFKRLMQERAIPLIVTNAALNSKDFYLKLNFRETDATDRQSQPKQPGEATFHNAVKMQSQVCPRTNYFQLKQRSQYYKQVICESLQDLYVDRQVYPPSENETVHRHWNQVSKQQEYFQIDPEEIAGEVWTWEEYQRQLATNATQQFREFRVIREIYSHALPELCSFSCRAGRQENFDMLGRSALNLNAIMEKISEGHYEDLVFILHDLTLFTASCRQMYANSEAVLENVAGIEEMIGKAQAKDYKR